MTVIQFVFATETNLDTLEPLKHWTNNLDSLEPLKQWLETLRDYEKYKTLAISQESTTNPTRGSSCHAGHEIPENCAAKGGTQKSAEEKVFQKKRGKKKNKRAKYFSALDFEDGDFSGDLDASGLPDSAGLFRPAGVKGNPTNNSAWVPTLRRKESAFNIDRVLEISGRVFLF